MFTRLLDHFAGKLVGLFDAFGLWFDDIVGELRRLMSDLAVLLGERALDEAHTVRYAGHMCINVLNESDPRSTDHPTALRAHAGMWT
ncbi:hypothetical protein [Halalkalicoccus salilacus]|uniref:hypothetical protein n=1 Tax=Halalkalicoccus sp. GCM10025704 TaxID=3252662 RepID=UPI0036F43444